MITCSFVGDYESADRPGSVLIGVTDAGKVGAIGSPCLASMKLEWETLLVGENLLEEHVRSGR